MTTINYAGPLPAPAYLAWTPDVAGALIAAAFSTVLIGFGTALGLGVVSAAPTWRDAACCWPRPFLRSRSARKPGVNSALEISPSTSDFVRQVAISDMFEIESSKLAQQKGDAEEKALASKMVTDHSKTSTELKGLVSNGKVKAELPAALDASHQSKIGKLKEARGNDFSSNFKSMQVSAHKDAVDLFERYAQGGENTDLKDWAGRPCPRSSITSRWRRNSARSRRPRLAKAGNDRDAGAMPGPRAPRSDPCPSLPVADFVSIAQTRDLWPHHLLSDGSRA